MEYEAFLDKVKEELPGYLNQEYADASIQIKYVEKHTKNSYLGLEVVPNGENMGVYLDLQDAYALFNEGVPMNDIMQQIAEKAQIGIENRPMEFHQLLSGYDNWKQNLMLEVIPVAGNYERLLHCPHQIVSDMAITYRIANRFVDNEIASIRVTNEFLKGYGITEQQLYADAMEYAPKQFPAEMKSMTAVLSELTGMPEEDFKAMEKMSVPELYVLNTSENVFGAAALFYPGKMEELARHFEGDFIILPSSIDEVLLIRDSGDISYDALRDMVQKINEETVPPDKQLSDEAYHYDAKGKVFERCSEYEERVKNPERTDFISKLDALQDKKPLMHEPKACRDDLSR